MKRALVIPLHVAPAISLALVAQVSADQSPISGTGWTQDMVIGVSEPVDSSAVTATMDGGTNKNGYAWYELGQNSSAPTTGLPMGATFTSASDSTTSYALQPANTNNAILVDNNGNSGTFTLSSPAPYLTLSFLTSTGSGNNTINYQIDFAGGGTETGSFSSPDWFNNTPVAIGAGGRLDTSGAYDAVSSPGGDPKLYQEDITLADATDPVQDVQFSLGSGGGHTAIMAVSGAAAVPEPSSLLVLGGMVTLMLGRRRAAARP